VRCGREDDVDAVGHSGDDFGPKIVDSTVAGRKILISQDPK